MKHSIFAVCLSIVTILLNPSAYACWEDIPVKKLVRTENLIITGKLGNVSGVKIRNAPRAMAAGMITVDRVLKNEIEGLKLEPGGKIQLVMPDPEAVLRVSTDLLYKEGTNGIWLLHRRPDMSFEATYPKDFQPLNQLEEIEAAVSEAKTSLLVEVTGRVPIPSKNVAPGAVIAQLFEYPLTEARGVGKEVGRVTLSPFEIQAGREASFRLSLTAARKPDRKYYLTVLIHPDSKGGKRLFYSDGHFVGRQENYESVNVIMKPGRR